jgi:hypothetical protein
VAGAGVTAGVATGAGVTVSTFGIAHGEGGEVGGADCSGFTAACGAGTGADVTAGKVRGAAGAGDGRTTIGNGASGAGVCGAVGTSDGVGTRAKRGAAVAGCVWDVAQQVEHSSVCGWVCLHPSARDRLSKPPAQIVLERFMRSSLFQRTNAASAAGASCRHPRN